MKRFGFSWLLCAVLGPAVLFPAPAMAISNIPTWLYRQNDRCGPSDLVPAACAAPAEKERYCQGFAALLGEVGSAGERIKWEESVVWCWTMIEEWHECEVPDPRLYPRCREDAIQLRSPSFEPCRWMGFEHARILYLNDLDRRCLKAPTHGA